MNAVWTEGRVNGYFNFITLVSVFPRSLELWVQLKNLKFTMWV